MATLALLATKSLSTNRPVRLRPVHSLVLWIVRTMRHRRFSCGKRQKNALTAMSGTSVWQWTTSGFHRANTGANHSGKHSAASRSKR